MTLKQTHHTVCVSCGTCNMLLGTNSPPLVNQLFSHFLYFTATASAALSMACQDTKGKECSSNGGESKKSKDEGCNRKREKK